MFADVCLFDCLLVFSFASPFFNYGPRLLVIFWGSAWTIEFLQDFGNLPALIGDDRQLSIPGSLALPYLDITVQTPGNKESAECSNRGICSPSSGLCTCSNNFDTSDGYNGPGQRGDCGYATALIQACPGTVSCSAHGTLDSHLLMLCERGCNWIVVG